jgi:hypothetical protein
LVLKPQFHATPTDAACKETTSLPACSGKVLSVCWVDGQRKQAQQQRPKTEAARGTATMRDTKEEVD